MSQAFVNVLRYDERDARQRFRRGACFARGEEPSPGGELGRGRGTGRDGTPGPGGGGGRREEEEEEEEEEMWRQVRVGDF